MKDRIEWTRMVSDCITGYRSARGDADALPPRTFIRAWMNRNFGLQKIPGRLFRLFYRSDKEELNEAFRAGNRARKKESIVNTTNTAILSPKQQIKLFMADVKKYRKWLIEQGKREAFENKDEIWWPGEDFEAPVGIYFTQDNLFEIQDNGIICVDSDIDFRNYPYEIHLPDKLYCTGKIHFENCDGLIRLPEHLETDEFIIFENCKNLKHLSDYLESGGVSVTIIDCENLEEIPSGFQLNGSLEIENCPKINSIPYNLRIYPCEYIKIDLNSPLRKFFDDCKIEYEIEYDAIYIRGRNWEKWQLKHKYITEAFRAGNRARKQESAADAVQGTEDNSPKGQLSRWAAEIVKAVNEASAKSSIWTADNFGDYIEIDDAPDEHYYMHRIKVNSWRGCIDDFDIDFENGYAAGYIHIYVPVNPEDGYAFSIGGACDGKDVNESYNIYDTFENAVSESIEEIIDCIEFWNKEVTERMSVYDDYDMDEAFRAGNSARKKESAADAAQGSFEELHYSDIPVLNTQMNRLRDLVSPDDVKNIGGDAIAFGIDIPCDFEFYFNISIYPLEKTGIYSIHVMFTVEGLETYMYDGDEVDSWDLEYVFDRIVDAVEHPEKFEEYRAGGYEKMYG